ncbi:MAG: hypothetical protein SF123_03580, partial [Chloroflexota bacterium]|nr:hypothetical protein [Chloroflexota bacterium]
LDLIHFPSLIFYELVFNLSTLMQAAARSYRLNQTHAHCKVFYLYAEGTMEQTAVHLMSRKQRAAKLLTGDIGLTGLDALTESEGGFEEALLEAIGRDETLLDPSQLFKVAGAVSEIDIEDAGYWNVENAPMAAEAMSDALIENKADPLIALALEMGATVTPIDAPTTEPVIAAAEQSEPRPVEAVTAYLETVHLIADEREWAKRRADLLTMLNGGTVDAIAAWLTEQRIVFPGFEREVAAKVVLLITGQTVPPTVGSPRRAAPKRTPRAERPPLVFPQREAMYEEARAQQLALF